MSEGNGHERIEPTREQIKQALERIRKGQERLAETVEGKGLPKLGAKDADAFIQALIDNPILKEMPASEEELERWERENPQKAKQYRDAVYRIIEEFDIGQDGQKSS